MQLDSYVPGISSLNQGPLKDIYGMKIDVSIINLQS